ncbi:alpha/beta fold hydrolase [Solicola gregarius]|uniref:Alpha/beta hydrolase n=1 Tax=Solicola gregarius TaxID=2908642 RepID=A0AA46YNM3_9ACTN|nr:alpha/beta fold hydrolase [Solicola gregarius]UYM06823.1 alpha/beta hydrolase [Solicola gregarius]
MAWFERDGQRTYFEDAGQGEAVLALPGWGGSIAEFARLRAELADGFRVVAADLPGSGRSHPQPRAYPATFYRDDARTFLDLLDHLAIDAAHVVGFSDGGEVGLVMAGLAPDRIRSVVAWGAAGYLEPTPETSAGLSRLIDDPPESLLPLAAYLAEAYGADHARTMAANWSAALAEIAAAGGSISRDLADRVTSPALLITGSDDPFCPPRVVRETVGALPRGEFIEVEGGGHPLHLSHTDWLHAVVLDWLGEH